MSLNYWYPCFPILSAALDYIKHSAVEFEITNQKEKLSRATPMPNKVKYIKKTKEKEVRLSYTGNLAF